MRRKIVYLGFLAIALWMAAIAVSCARNSPPGVVEGKVSVGPLTPVERAPEPGISTPTVPPQVFTSRHVNVYHADGIRLVRTVPFNPDGTYRIEIEPGEYVIALPPGGIEQARGLPQKVTVRSGETVRLDFDIDTGIR